MKNNVGLGKEPNQPYSILESQYSKSGRHHTSVGDDKVACSPNPIHRFASLKESRPIFLPVNSPTASRMFSPSRFVRDRPIDFLYISSFTSMQNIRRSPSSCHLVSCSYKSSWKCFCFCGHIRAFLVVKKNLLCC